MKKLNGVLVLVVLMVALIGVMVVNASELAPVTTFDSPLQPYPYPMYTIYLPFVGSGW